MIHTKTCEKLSKFVDVTAKILSVFFPDAVYIRLYSSYSGSKHIQHIQRVMLECLQTSQPM